MVTRRTLACFLFLFLFHTQRAVGGSVGQMAPLSAKFRQAADAVRRADVIVVTAGAGMGVDSGLPDFRGNEGLWEYYPPLRHLGVGFASMANPSWFDTDPVLAWGFYGHRL
eukprot:Rhum_TRINITY_DN14803_c0_g2::Rhum_TRINITY_DN14803_c0_g2_i2::g.119654::m.119654